MVSSAESYPTFVDLDGDGDLDLSVSGLTQNITYYQNNQPTPQVNSPPTAPSLLAPANGASVIGSATVSWGRSTDPNGVL